MATQAKAPSDAAARNPMASIDPKSEKAVRIAELTASDPQFRDAAPLDSVIAAKKQPGLRIAQVVRIVMEGYADRPALGQRARELVTDPATGRRTLRLLPRFETITYRELWGRARALAADWHHDDVAPFAAGDFVCNLGFASPDYAAVIIAGIHLGAVIVPLQTSAPPRQHADIMAETGPRIMTVGIDYLDAAVDALLLGPAAPRLIVFDYDARDDDQRERLERARRRLAEAGAPTRVDTLAECVERAASLPEAPLFVPAPDDNPLAWLFYTSGSTGTPKGAMFMERHVVGTWLHSAGMPAITLSFMPMSHGVGNGYMLLALANGGTSYCAPKSDLSTLFEDLPLVRPTMASLVPRVCELFYQRYLGEVDRRIAAGAAPGDAEAEAKRDMRENLLGGRLISVGCGSASLAPETYAFMESMLGMHMPIGYSSTEIANGTVLVDWKIQRPMVIDYKLADVPELGYFNTDKPHPRGELLVKTASFMGGYYKQPDLTAEKLDADGFYRTGDVMAELGPDHLVYLDRCNSVQKLSQGEFVAVSKLEALYVHSPAIRQIYLYGNSARAYLLAVVVPTDELLAEHGGDLEAVKQAVRQAVQALAEEQRLNSYEIPRDFLIETEPFSQKNGLLSEIGKHLRPRLKEHYGDRLEAIYARLAQDQVELLRALRTGGEGKSLVERVGLALQASLGVSESDVGPDARFADLGGDSLTALAFSVLLEEIFGVEVPVGIIIGPAGTVQYLADYIESERGGGRRQSFAAVHGGDSEVMKASDLRLDKFIDADILAAAPSLPRPVADPRTVLVTGATGFLGRFQAMAWLEKLAASDGKLVLLARGSDAADARRRIEAALDSDPALIGRFRALGDHVDIVPADLALPNLGLSDHDWTRLAETVDLIVHPAAHVNHRLPYHQLFAANVAGTAELIRMALTHRMKPIHYVSTLGVNKFADRLVDEDADIRAAIPTAAIDDGYANGYGISKWASEVLLREAHDLCGLPVSVFRPGMILAHSAYVGQLNVPDMFSRLLVSLITTGIAPATFYARTLANGRPKARYDGLTVDFLADAITAIGARNIQGFHSYNLSSPHEDGVSLDTIVDWLVEAGCAIERIDDYDLWLQRFETALRALPDDKKHQSVLAILSPYARPQSTGSAASLPTARFSEASGAAGLDIPHISSALIAKYVADLGHHAML